MPAALPYFPQTQSAHAVDLVANGDQADLALTTHTYDFVVLDIGLPGMSGFEIVWRRQARKSSVPVLILTVLGLLIRCGSPTIEINFLEEPKSLYFVLT
ncbi:MAG TPA: response regulator [Noviherbaspirillum sp.]|nr:response regulator [Noviherbaspirillum sp.]